MDILFSNVEIFDFLKKMAVEDCVMDMITSYRPVIHRQQPFHDISLLPK